GSTTRSSVIASSLGSRHGGCSCMMSRGWQPALRNPGTRDYSPMSHTIQRCLLWKMASLTLVGTAFAFLTAGMVSAQVVKNKEEPLEGPRGKKGSLIVSGYTRPG